MEESSEDLDMGDTGPTEQMILFDPPKPEAVVGEKNATSQATVSDSQVDAHQCSFCGSGVNMDDDSVYREILAWVRNANKDSATLRLYTGKLACGDCVSKLRKGMDTGQPTIDEAMEMPGQTSVAEHASFLEASEAYRRGQQDAVTGQPATVPDDPTAAADYRAGYESISDDDFMSELERKHGGSPVVDETLGGIVRKFYPDGTVIESKSKEG